MFFQPVKNNKKKPQAIQNVRKTKPRKNKRKKTSRNKIKTIALAKENCISANKPRFVHFVTVVIFFLK